MRNPITVVKKFIANCTEPPRSPIWPSVRRNHLQKEPTCQWCGGVNNLQVHHIAPFHIRPDLELYDENLITLCECMGLDCHLEKGHLGNFHDFNPKIRLQCAEHKRVTGGVEHV